MLGVGPGVSVGGGIEPGTGLGTGGTVMLPGDGGEDCRLSDKPSYAPCWEESVELQLTPAGWDLCGRIDRVRVSE